jgi:ClpX C4-type zinc finger
MARSGPFTKQRREKSMRWSRDYSEPERAAIHCSFCGASQHEANQFIAGPHIFVCDDCVMLMFMMLGKNDASWFARASTGMHAP